MTPATVLASIKGNLVQIKDLKNSYNPTMPAFINTLKGLNMEAGYWVKVDAAVSFELEGSVPEGASIAVKPGWNLVGYPRENKAPTADELTSLGDTVVQFKNLKDSYNPALPAFINTLKVITPGLGYWLKVSKDAVWNVGDVSGDGGNRDKVKMTSSGDSRWGSVEVYPNVSATVLAQVTVAGKAVSSGSVVGAFMGNELRGQHEVVLADGRSYVAINVNLPEAERVRYRIWDEESGKEYGVGKTMTLEMGETYGTATELVKLNGVVPPERPILSSVSVFPFSFRFDTEPNRGYSIEGSADLKSWKVLEEFKSSKRSHQFRDARKALFQHQYYRVTVE